MRHAVGDRHRRARGRSAGHVADAALPGAFRRAVMRIDSDPGVGEFGHVGAADQDEAGTAQPRHHRRVGFRRRGILQRPGAGAGHLSLDVEQILDRDGNAGEWRRRRLDRAQPVHRFRRLDRGLDIDMNEGPRTLACFVGDPGKALIDKLSGAGAAMFEIVGQCGKCRGVRHGSVASSIGYLLSGTASISRSSNAELSDLPCASSASDRVTPPPSAWLMTKFSAEMLGSS